MYIPLGEGVAEDLWAEDRGRLPPPVCSFLSFVWSFKYGKKFMDCGYGYEWSAGKY